MRRWESIERTCAYEHPTYGLAFVTWAWRALERTLGEWAWVPVAVEWDMFTPDDERKILERELWMCGLTPPPQPREAGGQGLTRLRVGEMDGISGSGPVSPEGPPELPEGSLFG